jgi:hypothetical protein
VIPCVWHAYINYYWKLEEWLDWLDSFIFIVSTRSAGLTRGSRGLSWYTRWRQRLVLHRNHLYKWPDIIITTDVLDYSPLASYLLTFCLRIPPSGVRCTWIRTSHCSTDKRDRIEHTHKLPRKGRNRRSRWSWRPPWGWQPNVSTPHNGRVIRYYPHQYALSTVALTWLLGMSLLYYGYMSRFQKYPTNKDVDFQS